MTEVEGERPELLWADVDDLHVNGAYQRSVEGRASKNLIRRIAEGFSWRELQTLNVCRRPEGGFNVVDGQHRLMGARLRGVPQLPCYVLPATSSQDEARHFIALNGNRVRMHTVDVFRAELAAGDEASLLVDQVCREAGVAICVTPCQSGQMPPGQTMAIGTIRDAVETMSKNAIVRGLKTLHAAFPDRPGQMRAPVMKALFLLYSGNLAAGRRVDDRVLAAIIKKEGPQRLEYSARLDESHRGGTTRWICAFLVKQYNKGAPPTAMIR